MCKLGILCGGKDKSVFNTNMIRHVKNKHSAQYSEFTAATQAKTLSQPTLTETLKNKEKLPEDSEKAKQITAKTAQIYGVG